NADVLAAARARACAAPPRGTEPTETALAEEHLEDVLDVAERLPARTCGAERVVPCAALRVGQDLVGTGDLLKALLGRRIAVHVRVELAREAPVRLPDVLVARVSRDAEHVVEVAGDRHGLLIELRREVRQAVGD